MWRSAPPALARRAGPEVGPVEAPRLAVDPNEQGCARRDVRGGGAAGPVDRDDRGGRRRPAAASRAHADLERTTRFDLLTGLPNRAQLTAELDARLGGASGRDGQVGGRHGALILVEFHRYAAINDTYGHEVGDGLLVAAAEQLGAALQPANGSSARAAPSSPCSARTWPTRRRPSRRADELQAALGRRLPHRHRPPAGGHQLGHRHARRSGHPGRGAGARRHRGPAARRLRRPRRVGGVRPVHAGHGDGRGGRAAPAARLSNAKSSGCCTCRWWPWTTTSWSAWRPCCGGPTPSGDWSARPSSCPCSTSPASSSRWATGPSRPPVARAWCGSRPSRPAS